MIYNTLKEYFGFNSFKAGQAEVIEHIIKGQSAAAIFPTGSGKSLCYQISALHLPCLTLVVSPLLALMQDQLEFMCKNGIPAARIDSSLDRNKEQEVMRDVRNGHCKILLISVERLKNERFRNFLSNIPISLLVIDEAHCISEWGHNFRPDYLKLPAYQRDFNIPQVLLLTATATPAVIDDMCRKFSIRRDAVVVTGFYRSNLHLDIKPVDEADKPATLYNILKDTPQLPTIVYTTLQKTAEEVAQYLSERGINAKAYHAGMNNDERENIQNSFMSGNTACIVATIAFGMGIDKRDVRRVIHYNLPKSIENYSQEIGRAGRDGQVSECTVLANLDNVNILENFIYGDTPEQENISRILEQIPRDGGNWEFKLNQLSTLSNIRLLALKTLLVYLEMKDIVKPLYSYFADYRYRNVISDDEIMGKFTGERRQFLETLFSGVDKKRVWTTVNFTQANNKAGRDRVITALEYFNEQGYIELAAKDITEVFEVKDRTFDLDFIAGELYDLFHRKEHIELGRIEQMLNFFSSGKCLSYALAAYFGEQLTQKNCGHCSVCQSGGVSIRHSVELPPLSTFDFHELTRKFIEKLNQTPSSELLTRFLCGVNLPCFTLMKAKQLQGFGILERYRYADVHEWVMAKMPFTF
ncbi:MAG: RecQ family ATP-dependent DNA helicase [Victivallales bacterium]|nr:RecQ family ATP-dependent DNA helicase [Victivallales bacterium]